MKKPISDAYTLINAVRDLESSLKRQNLIFMGCYFAAKRKYAQELQYIFFMGE